MSFCELLACPAGSAFRPTHRLKANRNKAPSGSCGFHNLHAMTRYGLGR